MTASAFADRNLSDIAASLPGATAVFRQRKMDFCCGGAVPLAEAAAARGVDLAAIEADLAALAGDAGVPDTDLPTSALIGRILERYHLAHRRELPELIRLARRVEAVHRGVEGAPVGLADALEETELALADHMAKEEGVLFPMILAGRGGMAGAPIAVMRHEHDDHGERLAQLLALSNDATPPAGACTTWRALCAGLRKFVDDLQDHVHLENNVLFPRFGA
ncbi:iron-sulfur cluster repair protein YtfE [Roseomonas sp. JC162]|uniref:Iron-sulfur cluster repair protein YtfE n=1 Tax=Neoroseomonas marina TaxID=1232220 RepID=A0A848EIY7_9PROT|nr:iron-sulfur cluster repair protein YtfE [Neoroseomonas marina]NMJ43348.1 iron-sulfur cluster repair protein YtfE [Neoroseomonas marina]